jgi:hypothetical protein
MGPPVKSRADLVPRTASSEVSSPGTWRLLLAASPRLSSLDQRPIQRGEQRPQEQGRIVPDRRLVLLRDTGLNDRSMLLLNEAAEEYGWNFPPGGEKALAKKRNESDRSRQ